MSTRVNKSELTKLTIANQLDPQRLEPLETLAALFPFTGHFNSKQVKKVVYRLKRISELKSLC